MTMGSLIKELRTAAGLTQEELGKKLSPPVNRAAVNKWEGGRVSNIKRGYIEQMARIFGVDPVKLMCFDEMPPPAALTEDELQHIRVYRELDRRGRGVVDYILAEEHYRCRQARKDLVPMPYAGQRAAAGRWIYDETIPVEAVMVPPKAGADFVIGISGDSMSPTFKDGDQVYVKRTTDLSYGDIGLFLVDGEMYVKELAPEGLRSHNPVWPVIRSDNVIVIGKVLGAV